MSTVEGRQEITNLVNDDWYYLGGELNESNITPWNHWVRYCETKLPPRNPKKPPRKIRKEKCICGQPIEYNCWIAKKVENDKLQVKVVGSHCIDKFVTVRRRCEDCDISHKNNKYNLCKPCLKKRQRKPIQNCLSCYTRINFNSGENYKYCYSCHTGSDSCN